MHIWLCGLPHSQYTTIGPGWVSGGCRVLSVCGWRWAVRLILTRCHIIGHQVAVESWETTINLEVILPNGTHAYVWLQLSFYSHLIPPSPMLLERMPIQSLLVAFVMPLWIGCFIAGLCAGQKERQASREPVRKRTADVLGSNAAFTPDVGTIGHMSFNHSVILSFVK